MTDPIRILLVDDDPDAGRIVAWQLRRGWRGDLAGGAGYELQHVHDPDAGRAALAAGGFSCCLMDQRLGGITGTHLLQVYRSWGGDSPVILLTQHDDARTFDLAWRQQASDVLIKDRIDAAQLCQTIIRVVRDGAAMADLRQRLAAAEARIRELQSGLQGDGR